jgi:MFS family permease
MPLRLLQIPFSPDIVNRSCPDILAVDDEAFMGYGRKYSLVQNGGGTLWLVTKESDGRDARSRWGILVVIYLCMLSYAVTLQSIPPVMSLVLARFHLSHHEAGLLMSMFSLPGIFLSLPSGVLSDRYGAKPVGVAALILTIAGTFLVATGQSFPMALAGRTTAGVGAVALVIIAPKAIAQWFAGRELGVAMGIFNTAMPLGTISMLNTAPVLSALWGWRTSVWASLAFVVAALVIFSTLYRNPMTVTEEKTKIGRSVGKVGQVGLPIRLVGASWGFFNASVMSFFTFAPDFLLSKGLVLGKAGFDTSLVMIGSMLFSPVIGYLTDRVGYKAAFIGAGGVGMAALLLLVPLIGHGFAILFVGIGLTAALIPAPVYSLAADVVSRDRLGLGYGILSTLNNVGMFVGPQIVGLTRDITGAYTASFWLMAFFAFLGTASMAVMRATRRQICHTS